MKHELKAFIEKYSPIVSVAEPRNMLSELAEILECCEGEDPAEGPGSVTTTDFKYAKMQTVHQLLVNTVVHRVDSQASAIELARLVDAAYGAIDAAPEEKSVQSSVVDDEGLLGDFADAIIWLQGGKKVARECWRKGWSISLNKGQTDISLFIPGAKGGSKSWIGEPSELLANDWYVVS